MKFIVMVIQIFDLFIIIYVQWIFVYFVFPVDDTNFVEISEFTSNTPDLVF